MKQTKIFSLGVLLACALISHAQPFKNAFEYVEFLGTQSEAVTKDRNTQTPQERERVLQELLERTGLKITPSRRKSPTNKNQ